MATEPRDVVGRPVNHPNSDTLRQISRINVFELVDDQLVRRFDSVDLARGLPFFTKGLHIRQGQHALVLAKDQIIPLGPGTHGVTATRVDTDFLGRILSHLSGGKYCEIYLIRDGEFKVTLGDPVRQVETVIQQSKRDIIAEQLTAKLDMPFDPGDSIVSIISKYMARHRRQE